MSAIIETRRLMPAEGESFQSTRFHLSSLCVAPKEWHLKLHQVILLI